MGGTKLRSFGAQRVLGTVSTSVYIIKENANNHTQQITPPTLVSKSTEEDTVDTGLVPLAVSGGVTLLEPASSLLEDREGRPWVTACHGDRGESHPPSPHLASRHLVTETERLSTYSRQDSFS